MSSVLACSNGHGAGNASNDSTARSRWRSAATELPSAAATSPRARLAKPSSVGSRSAFVISTRRSSWRDASSSAPSATRQPISAASSSATACSSRFPSRWQASIAAVNNSCASAFRPDTAAIWPSTDLLSPSISARSTSGGARRSMSAIASSACRRARSRSPRGSATRAFHKRQWGSSDSRPV